jgi:hypothetical protein
MINIEQIIYSSIFVIVKYCNEGYKLIGVYDNGEYTYFTNKSVFTEAELKRKFKNDSTIFNVDDIVDIYCSDNAIKNNYKYYRNLNLTRGFSIIFKYELYILSHFEENPVKLTSIKKTNDTLTTYHVISYDEGLRIINYACLKYCLVDSVKDIIRKNFLDIFVKEDNINGKYFVSDIFDINQQDYGIKYSLVDNYNK